MLLGWEDDAVALSAPGGSCFRSEHLSEMLAPSFLFSFLGYTPCKADAGFGTCIPVPHAGDPAWVLDSWHERGPDLVLWARGRLNSPICLPHFQIQWKQVKKKILNTVFMAICIQIKSCVTLTELGSFHWCEASIWSYAEHCVDEGRSTSAGLTQGSQSLPANYLPKYAVYDHDLNWSFWHSQGSSICMGSHRSTDAHSPHMAVESLTQTTQGLIPGPTLVLNCSFRALM